MKRTVESSLDQIIHRFDCEIRLARASELALAGRLLEAETLLVSRDRFPDTWGELDLLARIRVREGKLADALKLWGRGACIPTHSSYARARLVSLENYAAARFRRQQQIFILLWALWTSAVVAVITLVVRRAFQ